MKKIGLILVIMLVMASSVYAGEVLKGIAESTTPTTMNDGTVTNIWVDTEGRLRAGVEGAVAADSASTAQPVPIGGIAESTVPTEVADADAVQAWFDTFGRLLTYGSNPSVGAMDVNIINSPPVYDACTHLLDVTVNANGESFNGTMTIGDADKVTVYVWDDETAAADDSEVNVTIELSPDGTALMTAQTGMVNSEDQAAAAAADWTFDTDEERYFWFPQPVTAQQLKATVTCDADCDASDYHAFDLWVCTNE